MRKEVLFDALVGKVLTRIERTTEHEDTLRFFANDGSEYLMYHDQDCCETVTIEDICGNLEDLVGAPLLLACAVSQEAEDSGGTQTWTFYHLATVKGYVTIRWYGESNGYYSERVSFYQVK